MDKIILISAIQNPEEFNFLGKVLVSLSKKLHKKKLDCEATVICQVKDNENNECVFCTNENNNATDNALIFSRAKDIKKQLEGFSMLRLSASKQSVYYGFEKLKNFRLPDTDRVHIVVFDFRTDKNYIKGIGEHEIVESLEKNFGGSYSIHFIYQSAIEDVYTNINKLLVLKKVADRRKTNNSTLWQESKRNWSDELCRTIDGAVAAINPHNHNQSEN